MFKSLRWRLTFWFVALSMVLYTLSAVSGYFLFRNGLSSVIDDEIDALVSEIEPVIDLRENQPSLQEWAKTSKRIPFKFLPTIQLFDANKKLIEQHGPSGLAKLFGESVHEIRTAQYHARIFSMPLISDNRLIGYLQIQLSLRTVERAMRQFFEAMSLVAPFLLISLSIAGYFFSGKAVQPLEENFEVLRRFMNDAGHELSTPISIIQANAEAMECELPDNESIINKLTIIGRSAERLGTLVSDLVLLSKMESPQVQIKRTVLQLDKLLRAVLEDFEELFKSKGIKLVYQDLMPLSTTGDIDSLKRLIINLLQNALRYTDSGGDVVTQLDQIGRYARLTITDSGIGIPPESLPKIFDRFYRVEKSRSRAAGGAGLGLSIVKAIVESHRGKIFASSAVGKGTKFVVLLPKH